MNIRSTSLFKRGLLLSSLVAALVFLPGHIQGQSNNQQMQMPMPPKPQASPDKNKKKPDAKQQDKKGMGQTGEQDRMKKEMKPGQMNMPGMNMNMPEMNPAEEMLMQQASGTSANPASAPMEMITRKSGSWNFMFHGLIFLSDVQQTGPRGGDKFFSTNWFMGMAQRRVGKKGSLMFRAMMSLDPATVTKRRYPELFQTGETAFGRPIIDGQHPHDLFMELSVQYARQLSEKTTFNFYFAPVGDPALGPVAYPHRISAAEIPQATLAHHVQDSTHIANEVITAGITSGMFRFEASGFHGREPGENRWDIDAGAIDSWSTRLTLNPNNNWSGQISVGRLKHPEALEEGDIVRSTASITYNRPLAKGSWATSVIWGRNHKTAEQQNINSYLAESVLQFQHKNYVTGRIELVDKEELFNNQPAIKQQLARTVGSVFRIAAYTFGYTRDVKLFPKAQTGFGGNFTLYTIPSTIKPFYGDHPASFYMFMRIRFKGSNQMQQHQP